MLDARQLRTAWIILIGAGVASVAQGLLAGAFASGRFAAAAEDPNEYAALLLILGAVLCYGFRPWRFYMIFPALALLGGALMTQSRAGLVTLVVTPLLTSLVLALLGQLRWRQVSHFVGLYAAAGILAAFAFERFPALQDLFFARAATLSDYGDADTWVGRLGIWIGGLQMWQEHPILGVGAGNFGYLSPDYSFDAAYLSSVRGIAVAHNTLLSVGAELGVIGLFVFGWVLFRAIRWLSADSKQNSFAFALLMGIVGFIVISMSLSLEYNKIIYVLIGSQLALSVQANLAMRVEGFEFQRPHLQYAHQSA